MFFFLLCDGIVFAQAVTDIKEADQKIIIFPFDNYSDKVEAADIVMPVLVDSFINRGYKVIDEKLLYDFLCKEKVRETGYISRDLARKLRDKFGVDFILVGAIIRFANIDVPDLGLTARLVDASNGNILWADYSSAAGDDFTAVLGLGNVREIEMLVSMVINNLLASFSLEPFGKHAESAYKIAVMPFQNDSENKDAGMIASQFFIVSLFKSKSFIPVEYGEIKTNIFDLKLRTKGELDYRSVSELMERLNVDGFVIGTVELYSEGQRLLSPPAAAVTARLLNARNSRMLWYNRYQMTGDDDVIIYDWRRLRSVDKVANRIISKLVNGMGAIQWQ
ncbi:MAG: DUF799 family lipoprotein [Nitrospirae bacterium]|nr:DUF799 family lipoprotein [Nitrospirota bacterium]